jgi:hypothetical protein
MPFHLSGLLADQTILYSMTNRSRRVAPISTSLHVPTLDGGRIEMGRDVFLSIEVFKRDRDWAYEVVANRANTGSRTVLKTAGYYDTAGEAFKDGIAQVNQLEAQRRRPAGH